MTDPRVVPRRGGPDSTPGPDPTPTPDPRPTPDPTPISSICGITARGTPLSGFLSAYPLSNDAGGAAGFIAAFPKVAAAAKLAIGRVAINACRIASRVKSCTNCDRRNLTSIFAG